MNHELINMFPRMAVTDISNLSATHVEHLCHFIVRVMLTGLANLSNLVFRQLGMNILRANEGATFLRHVSEIIFLSPKKKMLRIDAGRVVALVANAHTFRDRAIVNLPREARSATLAPLLGSVPNHAVAEFVAVARPKPASFSLVDFGEEANFYGNLSVGSWYVGASHDAFSSVESRLVRLVQMLATSVRAALFSTSILPQETALNV